VSCWFNVTNIYLRQGERSEHWRRLRDWSFCPVFCVCLLCLSVYMMTKTNNSNDVIAPTAQAATPFVTFYPLPCSEAALPSLSPFFVCFLKLTSLGGDMHSHECLLFTVAYIIALTFFNYCEGNNLIFSLLSLLSLPSSLPFYLFLTFCPKIQLGCLREVSALSAGLERTEPANNFQYVLKLKLWSFYEKHKFAHSAIAKKSPRI